MLHLIHTLVCLFPCRFNSFLFASQQSQQSIYSVLPALLPVELITSTHTAATMTDDTKRESKYQQIEECLRGNDDDSTIDLWHLRQLSLSQGGLLDPKLRKRVWPIVTQALSSSSCAPPLLLRAGLPEHELRHIQQDVKHTVWNVKAHFRSQQPPKTIASVESYQPPSETDKRVTFSEDEQHPRGDAETSSISHSNEEGHSKAEPWQGNDDHWYDDHNSNNNINDHRSVSSFAGTTHSRRSTTSRKSSKLSRTKASKHEQRTVMNVMVNCLRTMPPIVSSSSSSELAIPPADHRRHYYTGFHDLTALIMVNVESLSISALLLYVHFILCHACPCV